MRIFLFVLAIIGSLVSIFIVLASMAMGDGMQQAIGIVLACAFSIIPYVIARSYAEIRRP